MFNDRIRTRYCHNGFSGQMLPGNPSQMQLHAGTIRNFPFPVPPQTPDWQTYMQQNPYYPQQYQPVSQVYLPYNHHQTPYPQHSAMQKDSQFLFKNPLQPKEEMYPPHHPYPMVPGGINPYPKGNLIPKQPGGMQSLMNSFKSQDGSVDFNKMVNTAGQMMNAVSQVTSLVKGLGGIFKA